MQAICQANGCSNELRRDNTIGFCRSHLSVTSRLPVRLCAVGGCGRELRVTNKSGYCSGHTQETPAVQRYNADRNAMLRARSADARATWPQCSADGCTNVIRPDNRSGRCQPHRGRRSGRAECSFEGCATLLNSRNKTGRCQKHRPKLWVAAVCAAEGCEKVLKAHNLTGFCRDHTNGYRRDYRLQREYGITLEQYDAILASQDGNCALCGKPPKPGGQRNASRLHVDHDHATGQVRRLLCNNCNRGLAAFFDDPDLMRRAAEYIEYFRMAVAA